MRLIKLLLSLSIVLRLPSYASGYSKNEVFSRTNVQANIVDDSQEYETLSHEARQLFQSDFPSPTDITHQLERFNENNDPEVFHEFTRATNSSKPIEYGDDHPFEVLRRRRMKETFGHNFTDEENSEHKLFLRRQLAPWDRNSVFRPIRIHTDTKFLALVSEDYGPEVAFLKAELIPRVKQLWEAALRTYPVSNNIVITSKDCPISSKYQNDTGIPNTDLVVFIAANLPSICNTATEPLVAATSCQYDQYDRPVVGRATVCLQDLDITDSYSTASLFKLIVHGFAHILGFSHKDYQYFYNPKTGMPRTERPFEKKSVTCVDGGQRVLAMPSADTIQPGFTKRGLRYFEVVTPTVRLLARNQFDCQVMNGARLENQPTNNGNCFGSHWESRLFAFDIVTAIALPTNQVLSEMTLGLFEDSGWYKADYTIAKTSPFGHGRGCDFVYEDCIQNGEVPEWSKGFFCNTLLSDRKYMCDPNHAHITYCDLVDYNQLSFAVPPNRNQRYFPDNPAYGGLMHTADYCPLTSKVQFDCTLGFGSDTERLDVEFFGPEARCMETTLDRPLCLKFECNVQLRRVVIHFNQYQPVICENAGDFMDLPGDSGEQFECPDFKSVCPEMSCPNNCSGRGVCDYTLDAPFCKCCDPTDLTEDCRNSPPGCDLEDKIFFCGFSEIDASDCNEDNQCPGGTDFECPGSMKCFGVTECGNPDNAGNKFCGLSKTLASECLSGTSCNNDYDCPPGSYCYDVDSCNQPTNNLPSTKHCGSTPYAASSCNDGTECLSNSDCPLGQVCYDVDCKDDKQNFCGSSVFGASQCSPGSECTTDIDCPEGQTCQDVIQCSQQPTSKYCGPTIATAAACFPGSGCRDDFDCPSGSSCYNVMCNQLNPKHCGPNLIAASSCSDGTECVSSSDCPYGQQCFDVQCKDNGNKFCGSSPSDASKCSLGSECYSDGDCPSGQGCHNVNFCSESFPSSPSPPTFPSSPNSPEKEDYGNKYCGLTLKAAEVCVPGSGCRNDSDCPNGLSCFEVEQCNQPSAKHCGLSEFGASSCNDGTECVTTLDCPKGQQCFEVDCKGSGNYFCGYSSYSSSKCLAGSECVSDSDCPGGQTCRFVNKCITPPTLSPTVMPTPKPRTAISVKYLLCLEHGLLTSTFKLTKNTEKEIRRILTKKFEDEMVDIDNKWGVDESHLRVETVSSQYLKDAPGNFECKCEVGDSKSVCSAVDSVVEVSFWEELDKDLIRYVLLLFQNFVVDDFRYPAKYWGFTPFETTTDLKLKGITPTEILEETWAKNFAAKIKEAMNFDSNNIDVPGFQVLISMVDSAVKTASNRSLRMLKPRLNRDLAADSSTVTLTIAGQYKAPPQVDNFGGIVEESIDRLVAPERVDGTFDGTLGPGVEVVESKPKLKSPGGPSIGGKDNDTYGNPISDDKNYNDDFNDDFVTREGSSSNIGTIFGILFAVVALLMLLSLLILLVNRRRKEKNMYIKEREFNNYDPNSEYDGDFYDQHQDRSLTLSNHDMNSQNYTRDSRFDEASEYDQSTYDDETYNDDTYADTMKTSVITDPTYRGGKFPGSYRYNEANSYEDGYGDNYDEGASGPSQYEDSRWGSEQRTYEGQPMQPIEDDFDDNDIGTYTGLTLRSNGADEVSCLMSVRGVEDTWINTSNRHLRSHSLPRSEHQEIANDATMRNHEQKEDVSEISAPTMISAPTVLLDRPRQRRYPMQHSSSGRSFETGVGSSLSRDISVAKTFTSAPTVLIDSSQKDEYEDLLDFANTNRGSKDEDLREEEDDNQSKIPEDFIMDESKMITNGSTTDSYASDETSQTKNIKYNYVRAQAPSKQTSSEGNIVIDESRMITNGIEIENDSNIDNNIQFDSNPSRMIKFEASGETKSEGSNGRTGSNPGLLPMIEEGIGEVSQEYQIKHGHEEILAHPSNLIEFKKNTEPSHMVTYSRRNSREIEDDNNAMNQTGGTHPSNMIKYTEPGNMITYSKKDSRAIEADSDVSSNMIEYNEGSEPGNMITYSRKGSRAIEADSDVSSNMIEYNEDSEPGNMITHARRETGALERHNNIPSNMIEYDEGSTPGNVVTHSRRETRALEGHNNVTMQQQVVPKKHDLGHPHPSFMIESNDNSEKNELDKSEFNPNTYTRNQKQNSNEADKMIEYDDRAQMSVSGIDSKSISNLRQQMPEALRPNILQRDDSIGKIGFVIDTSTGTVSNGALVDNKNSIAISGDNEQVLSNNNNLAHAPKKEAPEQKVQTPFERAKMEFEMNKKAMVLKKQKAMVLKKQDSVKDDFTCDGRTVLTID